MVTRARIGYHGTSKTSKYQQSVVDTLLYVCCRPLLIGIREYHRLIVSVEAKARQVFSPHCRPSGDIFFPLRHHGHQAASFAWAIVSTYSETRLKNCLVCYFFLFCTTELGLKKPINTHHKKTPIWELILQQNLIKGHPWQLHLFPQLPGTRRRPSAIALTARRHRLLAYSIPIPYCPSPTAILPHLHSQSPPHRQPPTTTHPPPSATPHSYVANPPPSPPSGASPQGSSPTTHPTSPSTRAGSVL